MKCDFSCTQEVLAKQEQEMYNAVSELQTKVLILAYFIFQYVNSYQGSTPTAFYPYVPWSKISSFDIFFLTVTFY